MRTTGAMPKAGEGGVEWRLAMMVDMVKVRTMSIHTADKIGYAAAPRSDINSAMQARTHLAVLTKPQQKHCRHIRQWLSIEVQRKLSSAMQMHQPCASPSLILG